MIRDKFPNIYDSLSRVISFSVLFHFRAKVHFNFFKCKYLPDLKQNFRDLAQLNFFELISFNTRKFHEQKSIPRRFTSQRNSKGLFLWNVELKTTFYLTPTQNVERAQKRVENLLVKGRELSGPGVQLYLLRGMFTKTVLYRQGSTVSSVHSRTRGIYMAYEKP